MSEDSPTSAGSIDDLEKGIKNEVGNDLANSEDTADVEAKADVAGQSTIVVWDGPDDPEFPQNL